MVTDLSKLLLILFFAWSPSQAWSDSEFRVEVVPLDKNEFALAKKIIKEIDYLDFEADNGCENRAQWVLFELALHKIQGTLIAVRGTHLRNGWAYHVAVAVGVEGIDEPYVFDRSFTTIPQKLSAWLRWVSPKKSVDELWGSLDKTFSLQIVNHYCSVQEARTFDPPVKGFQDSRLSKDVRRVLTGLKQMDLIEMTEGESFTCEDQGLEY